MDRYKIIVGQKYNNGIFCFIESQHNFGKKEHKTFKETKAENGWRTIEKRFTATKLCSRDMEAI